MKIQKVRADFFSIEISGEELGIVNNCINDALDLMGEGEFHARVGATRQEVLVLLESINGALRKAGPD